MSDEAVVIVFRSRLADGDPAEYERWAARMLELADEQPGFLGIKSFTADDGERVSISEFASLEHAMAWARHPEHLEAQKLGREKFYASFDLKTCGVLHHRIHPSGGAS